MTVPGFPGTDLQESGPAEFGWPVDVFEAISAVPLLEAFG